MACLGTRKCLHCCNFFKPDPRSAGRQRYCSALQCQKFSKRASQQKWLSKPQNKQYFHGPENVLRVQRWRADNPRYAKKSSSYRDSSSPLQETFNTQPIDKQRQKPDLRKETLQDILLAQPCVLIGLIANLTGSTLQDDIVETSIKLRQLGEDFLMRPEGGAGDLPIESSHRCFVHGYGDPPST